MVNSGDTDEMPPVAFHQSLHFLRRQNWSFKERNTIFLKILSCIPFNVYNEPFWHNCSKTLWEIPLVLKGLTYCLPLHKRLDPDQARQKVGLIWIQSVWHSNGIPERIFRKRWFWKNQQTTKKHEKFPRWQSDILYRSHHLRYPY